MSWGQHILLKRTAFTVRFLPTIFQEHRCFHWFLLACRPSSHFNTEVLLVKFKTLDSDYFFQILFIKMIVTVQIILLTFPMSKNCMISDVVNKEAKISCLLLSTLTILKQGTEFNKNYSPIIVKLVYNMCNILLWINGLVKNGPNNLVTRMVHDTPTLTYVMAFCGLMWETWWIVTTRLLKMFVWYLLLWVGLTLWNSKMHCHISGCFKYRRSLLLCSWEWQLYCVESLHLLGHPVTGGMLRDIIKETPCIYLN